VSTAHSSTAAAEHTNGRGAEAARRLSVLLVELAKSEPGVRKAVEAAIVNPLRIALDQLPHELDPEQITAATIPADLKREWVTPEGQAQIEVLPKGDPDDTKVLRNLVPAVLTIAPNATGPAVLLFEAGNTVVRAFIETGIFALAAIALLLWVTLRRIADVLLTLVPLLVAIVVTLELCVVLDLPLNFADIIALTLLLGVGVAFKIYYIMAWRSGKTALVQSTLTRAVIFSALTQANSVRQPVVVKRPGHLQHGRADGAGAAVHDGGGGAFPARPDGPTASGARAVRGKIRFRSAGQITGLTRPSRTPCRRDGRAMSTGLRSSLLMPRVSLALDNMRAFVILLVISFHSVLAYLNFLPASPFLFNSPPYLWRAFPIVDAARWLGFDLFCAWQDIFLMSLFFFLSGLFVWRSLERKGPRAFLHDRIVRLGLPFAFVVAVLMPLANYPTYLQTAVDPSYSAFLTPLARVAVLVMWTDVVFMATASGGFCCCRPPPVRTSMGCRADPGLVLCRCPADAIFCRLGGRLGHRIPPSCARHHAVGVGGVRAVRVPAQPPVALCGLFRRCGPRGMRHRARSVRAGWCACTVMDRLADCGAGLVASLDGAHCADNDGFRLAIGVTATL
jgi:hypothetical protein